MNNREKIDYIIVTGLNVISLVGLSYVIYRVIKDSDNTTAIRRQFWVNTDEYCMRKAREWANLSAYASDRVKHYSNVTA